MDRFKTIRVRPISGQFFGTGATKEPVKTDFNVSCDKAPREESPIGTVFVCKNLENAGKYYKVTDFKIYPLVAPDGSMYPEVIAGSQEAYKLLNPDSIVYDIEAPDPPPAPEPTVSEDASFVKPRTVLDRLKGKKTLRPPTLAKSGFFVDEIVWYTLLRNIRRRKNTLVIGPTGSGKTELIKLIFNALNKDLAIYDMGSMHDPMTGLLGSHRINAQGFSEFDYSKFSSDIQVKSGLLLDEISRAPQSANNILLPCLDSRRELPVEIASSTGVRNIPVTDELTFFATANIGAEYTGTTLLDRALVDRFFIIELGYLSVTNEAAVLVSRAGIDKAIAVSISKIAQSIRSLWGKGELSTAVSTRHTLEVAYLVSDGFSLLDSLEMIFLPMFEGSKASGERSIVAAILTSR